MSRATRFALYDDIGEEERDIEDLTQEELMTRLNEFLPRNAEVVFRDPTGTEYADDLQHALEAAHVTDIPELIQKARKWYGKAWDSFLKIPYRGRISTDRRAELVRLYNDLLDEGSRIGAKGMWGKDYANIYFALANASSVLSSGRPYKRWEDIIRPGRSAATEFKPQISEDTRHVMAREASMIRRNVIDLMERAGEELWEDEREGSSLYDVDPPIHKKMAPVRLLREIATLYRDPTSGLNVKDDTFGKALDRFIYRLTDLAQTINQEMGYRKVVPTLIAKAIAPAMTGQVGAEKLQSGRYFGRDDPESVSKKLLDLATAWGRYMGSILGTSYGSGLISKGYQLAMNAYRKRKCPYSRPLEDGEFHPLCANWIGPGTNIEKALKYPSINEADYCAMVHDLDYRKASRITNDAERKAAIRKADKDIMACLDKTNNPPYTQWAKWGIGAKMKAEDMVPSLLKLALGSAGRQYIGGCLYDCKCGNNLGPIVNSPTMRWS